MASISDRTGNVIKRAEQALMAAKNAALRPLGLTVPQYAALFLLAEQPGLSGAELARRALVTPQTMSTVLANLERKGLIERSTHPIHTSIVEIRLTRPGAEVLSAADDAAIRVEAAIDDVLRSDRASLHQLLARAIQALDDDRAR